MASGPTNGVVADHGNLATLTKVDKLRELIGNRISLPQLVVVGDQSSGKSSVLEGITGFAFPRDAELCTRYATQITCRRESYESVTVTIIPHNGADPDEAAKLRLFSRTLSRASQMDHAKLGEVFQDVHKELGISTGRRSPGAGPAGRAFSEHLLKIEICGPEQEHFTVIDVPGIFRKETEGLTTEADISMVKNMVMSYMSDHRTIILAIIPANVDPATQEILKLAKQVDPDMTRTMGVLTKPDLAIERTTQQIAFEHVTGERSDLTLGYYIIKNRGPDDINTTLEQGQVAEAAFFRRKPWVQLWELGRAGTAALKSQVRCLLIELIKKEFPKLMVEVNEELASLKSKRDAMGPPRSEPQTQRAYLGRLCDKYQAIVRDALGANYSVHAAFSRQDLRLATLMVQLGDQFAKGIQEEGHTRAFSSVKDMANATKLAGVFDSASVLPTNSTKSTGLFGGASITSTSNSVLQSTKPMFEPALFTFGQSPAKLQPQQQQQNLRLGVQSILTPKGRMDQIFPLAAGIREKGCNGSPSRGVEAKKLEETMANARILRIDESIMSYIQRVYDNSRGVDLGTFSSSLLAGVFQEQTRNWESITSAYIQIAICMVHGFIEEVLKEVCPNTRLRSELYTNHLVDSIKSFYDQARGHANFLLDIERKTTPFTLNNYFNDNLARVQGARQIAAIKKLSGAAAKTAAWQGAQDKDGDDDDDDMFTITIAQLKSLSTSHRSNAEHTQEAIYDVLKSYYKIAMKRFVDNVCLQAVHHYLLFAADGPLHVFNSELVHGLDDEQLDQIAGEGAAAKAQRAKLDRDIGKFGQALEVLKGSPSYSKKGDLY